MILFLLLIATARAHNDPKADSSWSRFAEFEQMLESLHASEKNPTEPEDLIRKVAVMAIKEDMRDAFLMDADYSPEGEASEDFSTVRMILKTPVKGGRTLTASELITAGRHVVDDLDIIIEELDESPPVPYQDHTNYDRNEVKTGLLSLAAIQSAAERYDFKRAVLEAQKARIQKDMDELDRLQSCETGLVIQKGKQK